MLHIYTGTGKGKTTAAVGLCARAAGWGRRIVFAQFLKGADTGEVKSLASLGARVVRDGSSKKFIFQMTPAEKEAYRITQNDVFRTACAAARDADLLVLDEAGDAIDTGMLAQADVLAFLRDRPAGLEVVLTGRGFSEALLGMADYLSVIENVRHPYDKKVAARKGIEF